MNIKEKKEMKVEIIELNMPYGGYIIRGHNHSKEDIVEAINKAEERNVDDSKYTIDDIKEITESYAHWCYGTWEGDSDIRYCQMDDKYKGVRGGFAVTFVDL